MKNTYSFKEERPFWKGQMLSQAARRSVSRLVLELVTRGEGGGSGLFSSCLESPSLPPSSWFPTQKWV